MDLLLRMTAPWIVQTTATQANVSATLRAYAERHGLRLLMFDAERCITFEDFYRHYWDVVHPPMSFGENLDALFEELRDSDVIGSNPVVVLFLNATKLLMNEGFDARDRLLDCFDGAGAFWAFPEGEPDEPPKPFHTVLHLNGAVPAQLHRYPSLTLSD